MEDVATRPAGSTPGPPSWWTIVVIAALYIAGVALNASQQDYFEAVFLALAGSLLTTGFITKRRRMMSEP